MSVTRAGHSRLLAVAPIGATLEKSTSGQRSGTRPFDEFVVSQNQSNGRRSIVDRNASVAGGGVRGGAAV